MTLPSGTITLNNDSVLIQNYTSDGISSIGNGIVGQVVQVGSDVTNWVANDIILYDKEYVINFKENGNTYSVINQQYILLKYTATISP